MIVSREDAVVSLAKDQNPRTLLRAQYLVQALFSKNGGRGMKNTTNRLASFDGTLLWFKKDIPNDPKAILVIVHGFAEHHQRYNHVAEFFMNQNMGVYRFDNRGHGKSGGKVGHLVSYENYIKDLHKIVEMAKNEFPHLPIFMLGHSMGGFIAVHYGLIHGGELKGQILSGAATHYNPSMKGIKKWLVTNLNKIKKDTLIANDLSKWISKDPQVVETYRNDPMVFKKATASLYYQFLIEGMNELVKNKENFNLPCLILHGAEDHIIKPEVSQWFYDTIQSSDKMIKIYPEAYHEILNEEMKAHVMEDTLNWILDRI